MFVDANIYKKTIRCSLCAKKLLFFLFFLKSANRSGAFFDFCVCVPKIVQSYFPSQSFSPKVVQSFSRSVVQSFSRSVVQPRISTHIVEMGYFVAHSTWRYKVLGDTRYCVTQGTMWRKVGNFSLMRFYTIFQKSTQI